MPQDPYQIRGIVTLNGSNYQGASVWAQDITEGTFTHRKKNVSLVFTNAAGEFIINLANITSAWADGDKVRVYVKAGEIFTWVDVGVFISRGYTTCNFALTRKSRLVDGARNTTAASGENGLFNLGTGIKRGLKDALQ